MIILWLTGCVGLFFHSLDIPCEPNQTLFITTDSSLRYDGRPCDGESCDSGPSCQLRAEGELLPTFANTADGLQIRHVSDVRAIGVEIGKITWEEDEAATRVSLPTIDLVTSSAGRINKMDRDVPTIECTDCTVLLGTSADLFITGQSDVILCGEVEVEFNPATDPNVVVFHYGPPLPHKADRIEIIEMGGTCPREEPVQ